MGVIKDINSIKNKEELRKLNMTRCSYCDCVISICMIFNHTIKCEVRKFSVCDRLEQLIIEIALIIFGYNVTDYVCIQNKFLQSKGIDFNRYLDFKIANNIYWLIDILKKSQSLPRFVMFPATEDNDFTQLLPNYILYYMINNIHYIYQKTPGVIFELRNEMCEKYEGIFDDNEIDWKATDILISDGLRISLQPNNIHILTENNIVNV